MVEAYSPLENDVSKARFMSDPTVSAPETDKAISSHALVTQIKQVAEELNCTPAQIVIAWLVRRGLVVLVKSVNPSRIESNLRGQLLFGSPESLLLSIDGCFKSLP